VPELVQEADLVVPTLEERYLVQEVVGCLGYEVPGESEGAPRQAIMLLRSPDLPPARLPLGPFVAAAVVCLLEED